MYHVFRREAGDVVEEETMEGTPKEIFDFLKLTGEVMVEDDLEADFEERYPKDILDNIKHYIDENFPFFARKNRGERLDIFVIKLLNQLKKR